MKIRFIMTAAILLSSARLSFAQTPDAQAPVAPSVAIAPVGIASFLSNLPRPSGGQFWVTGDYMLAFVRGTNLPPLVTTSVPGTPRTAAGVLGDPRTSTLFGSNWVDGDFRSGFRFGLGYWFNPEKTLGVEAGFIMTLSQTANFAANSTDGTILARPYTDATTGLPQAVLVAFPGSSNGSIDVSMHSGGFYSVNVDLTETAYDVGWFRVTSLLGYRFYRYDEALRINQVIAPLPTNIFPFPPGTQIISTDNFNTRSVFHGVDMGFRSQFIWNDFSLEVLTKLAFGRITRTFTIEGDQTVTAPGVAPVSQAAGVLALGSNSGTFSSGDWKAMPEAGFTLNWQIRNNISARLGYSFLFLNGVARAADQVDTTLNPNLFPGGPGVGVGPSRPAANHIRTDMWIQTINIGVQFTY